MERQTNDLMIIEFHLSCWLLWSVINIKKYIKYFIILDKTYENDVASRSFDVVLCCKLEGEDFPDDMHTLKNYIISLSNNTKVMVAT